MAEAAPFLGIISFGLTICKDLYAYYHAYKGFDSSINSAFESIAEVASTLVLLKDSCEDPGLDQERKDRVAACVYQCEDGLKKLSEKLQRLRIKDPDGFRQKSKALFKRSAFSFTKESLDGLRSSAVGVQGRLVLALQVLDLAGKLKSQKVLDCLENWSHGVTVTIDQISNDTQRLLSIAHSNEVDKIKDWLSPPDPWTNHHAARSLHQAGTGQWMLDNDAYKAWLGGSIRYLWLYGKAGCGKTILSSTIVEGVQRHRRQAVDFGFAPFYFTFSDKGKQSYEALLRSLVAQLGSQEPGLAVMREKYDQRHELQGGLNIQTLEAILLAVVSVYDTVFVVLDALDECPEESDARSKLFEGLNHLVKEADNLQILMTSRDESDIRDCMLRLSANQMQIQTRTVDNDISSYVAQQLSQGHYFKRLKRESLDLIQATITEKADGMFRWAFCQLAELSQSKSTRPSRIESALKSLPTTLDETYARMLERIRPADREDALILLRWLAHSMRPMTLAELQTAVIIRPEIDEVDFEDEGDFKDSLDILAGLVVFSNGADYTEQDQAMTKTRELTPATRIRLAHFSVKEYLESTRISESSASFFRLEAGACHRFLSQSCLTYLMSYSRSGEKTSPELDLKKFHLLRYAAHQWCEHSRLQSGDDVSREVALLECKDARLHWLWIEELGMDWLEYVEISSWEKLPSIFYAVARRLPHVVEELLEAGQDASAVGPHDEPLLVIATKTEEPDLAIVELLLAYGADVDATSWDYSRRSALIHAVARGLPLTKLLVNNGADVNYAGLWVTVLTAACMKGDLSVVEFLLERGTQVNIADNQGRTALTVASKEGHTEIVKLLIVKGANVNRLSYFDSSLREAAVSGYTDIVAMLIDAGADLSAEDGGPLLDALYYGHEHTVALLEARGANKLLLEQLDEILIWVCGNLPLTKLERTIDLLLNQGADVNARDSSPILAALLRGHEESVRLLEKRGAKTPPLERLNDALIKLCNDWDPDPLRIEMFLYQDADAHAEDSSLLLRALLTGDEPLVMMLERWGAKSPPLERLNDALIKLRKKPCPSARELRIIDMLVDRGADIDAGNKGSWPSTLLHFNRPEIFSD